MRNYNISVGLISVDYKVHWAMVASLLEMLPRDFSNYKFNPIFEQGIYLDELRNRVSLKFLDSGSDFLLFLDYDNGIHPDGIDFFMDDFEDDNIDIVSAAYTFKNDRGDYVAGFSTPIHPEGSYNWVEKSSFSSPLVNLSKAAGGKAGMVGAGCLMIRRRALTEITYPWFRTSWEMYDKSVMFWGEDTGFCRNAEKCGVDIYLDQRIRSPHMSGERCYPEEWRQVPKGGGHGQGDPISKELKCRV